MGRTPQVMIVEDDYLIAALIEEIVKSAGWQVVGPIGRVDEAVRTAAHVECDAAVLDVNVGGQAIYPVAEVLSERKVPFLFVTGYDAASLESHFRKRPRLGKPFRARELLGAVRGLLAQFAELRD